MSFVDRIKYFVCSLSILLCNRLSSAAMNNLLKTPEVSHSSLFRNSLCYATKKKSLPNAINTRMKDYAVIYKYVDIPDNSRLQGECCSLCGGDFKNSKFECHSTNIKYKCIKYEDNNVDCIFIPIPKDTSIKNNEDLINLYCKSDLKLCYNCMGKYLEPYLKKLSESFHQHCEEKGVNLTIPDAFKINVFQNNKRFSTLPKEFRFLYNEHCANDSPHNTKCFCGKLAIPNSSEPVIMCCDGHLCHVNCLLEKLSNGRNPELKNTPPAGFIIYENSEMCVCGKLVKSDELRFCCANGHLLHLNCLLEYFHCPYGNCEQKMKYICPYFNSIDTMTKKEGVNLLSVFNMAI